MGSRKRRELKNIYTEEDYFETLVVEVKCSYLPALVRKKVWRRRLRSHKLWESLIQ